MQQSSASVIARSSPPSINARSFSSAAARVPSSSTKPAARSRDLLRRFWNSAAGFWGQVRDAGVVVSILGLHRCSRRRRLSRANAM